MDKTNTSVRKDQSSTTQLKRQRYGLFMKNILTRKVDLDFTSVGSNIQDILQQKLIYILEGKCAVEGYIKNNSIQVKKYSAGELNSDHVQFTVVFECLVCNPVENQRIKARVLNVTKAGIRATSIGSGSEVSPLDIFIARDSNYDNKQFTTLKDGDEVNVKIIGQRYEINDPVISVLAELADQKPVLNLK